MGRGIREGGEAWKIRRTWERFCALKGAWRSRCWRLGEGESASRVGTAPRFFFFYCFIAAGEKAKDERGSGRLERSKKRGSESGVSLQQD